MDGCERTQSIQSEKGRDVNNTIKKRWTVEVAFGNFHGPVTFMIVFVHQYHRIGDDVCSPH